jgi:small-conductance mechanosensitive channel
LSKVFTVEFWQNFWQHAVQVALSRGLLILLIVVAFWISRLLLFRIIDSSLDRLQLRRKTSTRKEDISNRLLTLKGLSKSIAAYVLAFILIVMLVDAVGVNIAGLVTTAGIGGIAIGIGAQKLVKDVISGFFLIVEDQFDVGDYVTIGAATGIVEDLGMRITRIRDDSGKQWILSNGDISIVTNHSRAPVIGAIDIGLAVGVEVKRAEQIMAEVCASLFKSEPGNLHEEPKVAGMASWDAGRIVIKISVSSDPRTLGAEQIRVRTTIHDRLVSEGIDLA